MTATNASVFVTVGASLAGGFTSVFDKANTSVTKLGAALEGLNNKAGTIAAFGRAEADVLDAGRAWQAKVAKVDALGAALAKLPGPSEAATAAIKKAAEAHDQTKQAVEGNRAALKEHNAAMKAADSPTTEMKNRQKELRAALRQSIDANKATATSLKTLKDAARSGTAEQKALNAELGRAKIAAERASQALQMKRQALAAARAEMTKAGIDTRRLAQEELRLGDAIKKVEDRYKKLNAVRAAQQNNTRERHEMRGKIFDTMALGAATLGPIGASVKTAADFEYQLQLIGNTAEMTDAEVSALGQSIHKQAILTGQSSMDLQKALGFLIAAGMNAKTAEKSIGAVGKVSTATAADIEDVAKAAFTLNDSFKINPENLGKSLDILLKAGKEGNVEFKDMAKVLPTLGSSFQALKMGGNEAAASMAAGLEIARKGSATADEAATNMSNYLNKVMSPETLKKASKFGVDMYKVVSDAQKNGENPFEKSIEAVAKMTKGGDQKLLGELFQDTQVQNFLRPTIQNWEEYKRIKSEALKASGTTDRDFEKMQKTAKQGMNELGSAFQRLSIEIGKATTEQLGFLRGLVPVIESATEFVKQHPKVVGGIIAVTGALITMRLVTLGGGFAWTFLKGAVLTGSGVMQAAAARITLMTTANTALGGAAAVARGGLLAMTGTSVMSGLGAVAGGIKAVGIAMLTTPIGWVALAIAGAGFLIWKYWQPIKAFMGGVFDGFMEATQPMRNSLSALWENMKPVREMFSWIGDAISGVVHWIGELFTPFEATTEQMGAAKDAGHSMGLVLGEAFSSALKPLTLVVDMMNFIINNVGKVIEAAKSVGAVVGQKWDQAKEAVGSTVSSAGDSVKSGWNSLKDTVVNAPERIGNAFAPAASPTNLAPTVSGDVKAAIPKTSSTTTVTSSPTYNINVTGGSGSPEDMAAALRKTMADIEAKNRAKARTSMYDLPAY